MQIPQIVTKPELTVIGMRAAFIHALSPEATNFEVIGALWMRFVDCVDSVPNRVGESMYGIIYGEPERGLRDGVLDFSSPGGGPVASPIPPPIATPPDETRVAS